jgi:hypothetical protein
MTYPELYLSHIGVVVCETYQVQAPVQYILSLTSRQTAFSDAVAEMLLH